MGGTAPFGRFGYTNVDDSGRAAQLQEQLRIQAETFAAARRKRFSALGLRPGDAALDAGCGLGEVALLLAEFVGPTGRVVGVDLSEAMVEQARAATAEHPEIDIRWGDLQTGLDLAGASFDLVHSERVFMHLEDPVASVAELVRLLVPRGRLVIVDPDHFVTGFDADDLEGADLIWGHMTRHLMKNPRSGRRLRGMFLRAGLVDVHVDAEAVVQTDWTFGRDSFERMLDTALSVATEAGVERGRVEAFAADQRRRLDEGRFLRVINMFTAVGTKPA